ncbi:MAG: citramalate synthase [Clostridiales bacterium]|nr:citramalate synthase [Clostridiales bacterium]
MLSLSSTGGVWLTVDDKLKIASLLDTLGVHYIEAGNPGSNVKDALFFSRAQKELELKNAKLVAFGATVRKGISPKDDENIQSLLSANTEAVCIFGKCWDLHAEHILGVDLLENLGLIADTVAYLKGMGKEVIFDAEHFFDGYKHNKEYALACINTAAGSGADMVCLCDTNGGTFPHEVADAVTAAAAVCRAPISIHAHNDTGMADAVTLCAIMSGAVGFQATISGIGERCGNANLFTTLANLTLKLGYDTVPKENLKKMRAISVAYAEIANVRQLSRAPYVGKHAFYHKAGMHVDVILKAPHAMEHIDPALVGNHRETAISDIAGSRAMWERMRRVAPEISREDPAVKEVLNQIKEMELNGYQFEGADASLELLIRKKLGKFNHHFDLIAFKVLVEEPHSPDVSLATIEIGVGGEIEITAAQGNGPVNALDAAARKALERFYPSLRQIRLTDYKVRVLDTNATASEVRVVIETRDDKHTWSTVGVSTDVINASWIALVDSLEYKLLKDELEKGGES